jgi:hypothetical protein
VKISERNSGGSLKKSGNSEEKTEKKGLESSRV